jgi:hypothetical protein
MVQAWTAPGDLILDPFAASDAVVRVALEQGRRVLATDSNPLVAWATRLQATLPAPREIHAALARLGETRKEDQDLRASVEKLYASQCSQCGASVSVDYFVNRREGAKSLVAAKVYTCPQCGPRRDDATEADRQRAADAAPRGLSYHLLVQRLAADDTVHSSHLQSLLSLYTPRNLAALASLTQKLDAEFRQDAARNILAGLLLHALDVGTSLYPEPGALPVREVPAEFVEINIWRALETAARGLSDRAPALRLATQPTQVLQATSPAAFIGPGGARQLADQVAREGLDLAQKAALVLSSPARLDPSFWELSFLWTRWLFGKNAATPLEPLLEEKHQRWSWYGQALTNALTDASKLASPHAHLAVAFPSGSHAMIEALMLAAAPLFGLSDFAFRPTEQFARATEFGAVRGDYQAIWERREVEPAPAAANQLAAPVRAASLHAAQAILHARGEPLIYPWLHHAALEQLAQRELLAAAMDAKYREGDNAFQFVRHRMEEGFKEGFIHDFDQLQHDTRVLWIRREDANPPPPLTDRVEAVVRAALRAAGTLSAAALEDAVLEQFPGLLTPEIDLVTQCARAYADWKDEVWVWRSEAANAEFARARTLAAQLGVRLGFEVVEDAAPFDLVWRTEKIIPGSTSGSLRQEHIQEDAYAVLVRAHADFQELYTLRAAPLHGLVILPESQVALTRIRLTRDPRWPKRLERAGWEFMRAPMLEQLLSREHIESAELDLILGLDPPLAAGAEQMELF